MDLDETLKICTLCLPDVIDTVVNDVAKKMMADDEEEGDTLFLKSAHAAIDVGLRDKDVKKEVMEMFINKPLMQLDCTFLRHHIDLYTDILVAKIERVDERETPIFEVVVSSHTMSVFIGQRKTPLNIPGKYHLDQPIKLVKAACARQFHNVLCDFDGRNGLTKNGPTAIGPQYTAFCARLQETAGPLYLKDRTVVLSPQRFCSLLALRSHYHPL